MSPSRMSPVAWSCALAVAAALAACGGDPEERTPGPDATADALAPDGGGPGDATLPPADGGEPGDATTPPADGGEPGDATTPPADGGEPTDAGPGSCASNADCARGQLCSFGGLTCADRPIGRCVEAACTPDVTTMCLCDGRTFEGSSSCPPGPLSHYGPCDTGAACGTRGTGPCPDGQYCDYVDGSFCGAADEGGTCRPRPDACDTVYDPVCGCDGMTYSNACTAAAAGIDFATRGACGTPPGASCVDTICEPGLTCIGGPTCGDTWQCAALDRACTDDLVPYCACDGTTFQDSSTCPRRAFAYRGTCDRPEGLVSCDRATIACRRLEPTCPDGQAPMVVGTCWGPCVPIAQCACTPGEIRSTCPAVASSCGPEGHCLP